MQRTYCDICKKEVKDTGKAFAGDGVIKFSIVAEIKDAPEKDLCLGCMVRAIDKEAGKKLKRPYTKPVKPTINSHIAGSDPATN